SLVTEDISVELCKNDSFIDRVIGTLQKSDDAKFLLTLSALSSFSSCCSLLAKRKSVQAFLDNAIKSHDSAIATQFKERLDSILQKESQSDSVVMDVDD